MNIAEGQGRVSKKEFIRFLYIARRSLYETLTLLEIFYMRKWITAEQFEGFETHSTEIAKMINGLVKAIGERLEK